LYCLFSFQFDKHIQPGSYQLEVKSLTNAFPFHDTRFLYVESKTHSLFIQTNKVLYKPGDVVKYRVLILNAETKPVRVENGLKISISDASQNVIQQIDRQNALQGIFRGEFELSKDEKFGKWNIEAEFMDKRYQKTIEVAGYVSPKFQVTIRTPTFVARTTKTFSIFVEAKYVFGKPVKGTMTLKVTPIFKTENSWSKIGRSHVIISDIHGKYVADVHSHDLIVARNQSHSGILVETTVEDKASGLVGYGKDKVIAVETGKNRTKFDIQVTNFRFLLPGAHFFTTIHVKSKNGQPIPAKSSFVKFQSAFELIDHSQNVSVQTFKLDANGKVDVKIDVPSVPTRSLKIDVRYLYAHEEVYIAAKPLHVQVATTK
jgi:CD109 antigen